MSAAEVRAEARWRAGLILESVVGAGWSLDPEIEKCYGEADADRISEEIGKIARRLIGGQS
jgi:hypothetical protein